MRKIITILGLIVVASASIVLLRPGSMDPAPLLAVNLPLDEGAASAIGVSNAERARVEQSFGKLPIYFIENRGQFHEEVGFYVKGADKTLYFTPEGVTFSLAGETEEHWTVKLDFVGASPDVRPRGEDRAEAVFSYFKGRPEDWQAGLATYRKLVYEDLWPGIDLVYSGSVNQLKYEFVVEPGADPGRIRLAYRGATDVTVKETGELAVTTPVAGFEDARPYAYQKDGADRTEVSMAYALDDAPGDGARTFGFDLGGFDSAKALILDPAMLVYCGYIGGIDRDRGSGIAIDPEGNAYVTGNAKSTESSFPVVMGPDLTYNDEHPNAWDAFVVKVPGQFPKALSCRMGGGVNLGASRAPAPVLTINSSEGNAHHIVSLSTGDPIEVFMDCPPGGPNPAPFAVYVWLGAPSEATVTPHPKNLGDMCFPTPLTGGAPRPKKIWNNIGRYPQLGNPSYPSDPAPSVAFSRSSGLDDPITASFQGFIMDNASAANKPASITNAVILVVE